MKLLSVAEEISAPRKMPENEHELPIDANLLLYEVLVCCYSIRSNGPFKKAGSSHEGSRCAQIVGFPHPLSGCIN